VEVRVMRRIVAVTLGLWLAGCGSPPAGPELVIPVNALCSDCTTYVRCDAGSGNAAVFDPTFDLYALQPKGTLGQIATIWEFLVERVSPRKVDTRPMVVYQQRAGVTQAIDRKVQRDLTARTDLVQHRIQVPEGWVDQATGGWHGADGTLRGNCRVLTREEGAEVAGLFDTPS